MKKFYTVCAFAFTFIISHAVTPRATEELQAQVGFPCDCQLITNPAQLVQYNQCLGYSDMSSWSCTQLGSQCFLGGVATWIPAAPNTVYAGGTMGWIQAVAAGTGGPSYFDPSATQNGIPWGVLSETCNQRKPLGAIMRVVHDLWTGGASCTRTPNTATISTVASGMWSCQDV